MYTIVIAYGNLCTFAGVASPNLDEVETIACNLRRALPPIFRVYVDRAWSMCTCAYQAED